MNVLKTQFSGNLSSLITLKGVRKGRCYIPMRIKVVGCGLCTVGAKVFICLQSSQIHDSGRVILCGLVVSAFNRELRDYPGGWAMCSAAMIAKAMCCSVDSIVKHSNDITMRILNSTSAVYTSVCARISLLDDLESL